MSAADPLVTFSIALRHLSPDAKTAGVELPDVKLEGVPAKKLRALLNALAGLAPTVSYPVGPELRISSPDGMFVVQAKGGQLNFVSWSSSRPGAGALMAAQIFTAITGEGAEVEAAPVRKVTNSADEYFARKARRKNMITLVSLIAGVVLVNCFTVWFVTRPKKTLLPKYALLEKGPAERVLTTVAGVYETGGRAGDRRLQIEKGGTAELIKFGAERAALEKKLFTVKAAQTGEKTALLTSRRAMIEIKDSISVVLYGDLYRRVAR